MNLQEKVDKLMNKLETLEGALKDERKIRIKLEEELKECKQITIPILQKQLEDKDALLKTVFIDKIRLEKESMEKECKSKTIMTQSLDVNSYLNRIEYLEEGNRTLKKKLNDLTEEKMKMELNYKSKLQLEKEKTSILQRRIDESHQEVSKSNNKIKVLSNMNKNLLIEIKSLNGLLDETNSNREQLLFLLDYYKTEDELNKKSIQSANIRIRKMDQEYLGMNKLLLEYKNKISDMDITSHIFNVVRIGSIVDSPADLMFNKEDGHFVLIIKYVTSSVKVDILDIEELTFKDMDENQIVVKFKLEKNLKDEKFRTTEGKFIIKTFKEFQTKAYQNLDINKAKKEEKKKAKKIEADVQNIISIFG